jgi:hypothetical protein
MPEFGGFVGPAYESRSKYQDAQRSINLYPEIDPTPGAVSVMALMPTPGMREFIDIPTLASITARPVRFAHVPPSRPDLAVIAVGNQMVTILPSGASYTTTTFELSSNTGPMVAADNGTDIIVSDGPNWYSVGIESLTIAKIADPNVTGGYPTFLDGYIISNRPDTAQFYWSGLRALTWDGLDFATKEAWPDDLVTPWAEHRELWLLGTQTSEVWYNSGNTDNNTFERNQGAFMQHGCAAPFSVSRLGDTFAFVATDERGAAMIVVANGYAFKTISTPALDYEMSNYETVADAIAFTYRASGHEFYQVTFPTANVTWVYDITTNMWHQRAGRDSLGNLTRHRANCVMTYRGLTIVGDHQNGKLYELTDDVFKDGTDPIERIRRCPHILDDRKQVRYQELQVEFEPGVGIQTGVGSDPQAMLRWSDDGGSTWSNEHWTTIGAVGAYKNRARWTRMGAARDRVYEVRVSDPVKTVIIGATLNVRSGA